MFSSVLLLSFENLGFYLDSTSTPTLHPLHPQATMADLSMEDGAPSGQFADPAASVPATNASLLDLAVLISFIRSKVPHFLEPDGILQDSLKNLLLEDSTLEKLRRFISDPQCEAISIQRQLVKGKFCFFFLCALLIHIFFSRR